MVVGVISFLNLGANNNDNANNNDSITDYCYKTFARSSFPVQRINSAGGEEANKQEEEVSE